MNFYKEDGCQYMAEKKFRGEIVEEQLNFEKEWSMFMTSKMFPIEKRADTILNRLKEKLEQGNLALVIGAGVSISCGLPSWDRLVNTVFINLLNKKRMYRDETLAVIQSMNFNNNLLLLTQALTAIFSEEEITQSVKQIIESEKTSNSELLYAVCDLVEHMINTNDKLERPTYVFTFNYDNLLEDELKRRNNTIVNGNRFYINSNKSNSHHIIHLHGDLSSENNENIILSEHSYGEAYLRPKCRNSLSEIIEREITPLFIGFSFNDIFVRETLHKFALERNDCVAIGLLAKQDLIKQGDEKVNVSNEYMKGFTPNDQLGWSVMGKSPIPIRQQTFESIKEQFARNVLNSIGVEWWLANEWSELPLKIKELIE